MRNLALIILAIAGAALLAAVTRSVGPETSQASSHREAPLISEDPTADNTDLYAFRSPDKPNTLTIISNFIPAEDPAAGPNYYTFSPRVRYNINIDRTGDGRPEITYRFRFKTKPGQLFLGNTEQRYTVERIANGRSQIVARGLTPPNNIGPRTLMGKDYRQLAQSRVTDLRGGGKVFAGQRDDAFYADIGAIFDLLAIRKGTGDQGGGKDFFAGYAVHALALQIPIAQLDTKSHVIGIWSTSERQQLRVHDDGNIGKAWMQVSRLGNPLVNEVIIPTVKKDLWNMRMPAGDKSFAALLPHSDPRQGDEPALQARRAGDEPQGPRRSAADGREPAEAQLHRPHARRHAADQPVDPGHAAERFQAARRARGRPPGLAERAPAR